MIGLKFPLVLHLKEDAIYSALKYNPQDVRDSRASLTHCSCDLYG